MILRDGRLPTMLVAALALTCQRGGALFPWPAGEGRVAVDHAEVRTLNEGYQRTRSQVLVREIARPTRAALDYAAYHANFMIADPAPEDVSFSGTPDTFSPFRALIEKKTLTGDIRKTPLTPTEQQYPLSFVPLVQFLQARKVAGAGALEEVGAAVRGEAWGSRVREATPSQQVSEAFLHRPETGALELWVKIEFQPWFKAFRGLSDQDGDGFPELYGRVRTDRIDPAATDMLARDYMGHLLAPAELRLWANQLSSYWYRSFNTDLIAVGASWPDDHTEPDIKRELGGRVFSPATIVLRGKPQGKSTYEVFVVKGAGATGGQAAGQTMLKLQKSRPTQPSR